LHRVLPNLINKAALLGVRLQRINGLGQVKFTCGVQEGAGLSSGN